MLVDDEDQIVRMVQETLKGLGYHVTPRTSSVEALEAFRAQPDRFDLVITDIIMPEKEGIETIIELRRDFPDVKIIAISGGGQIAPEACLLFAKKLGAQRTFTKPVPRQDMINAVKELLEQGE